ncbi:DUF4352 domain-containing protein [Candidatus Micrarchaeota archaeon]|nr:DUF4352 domain-containing protein [Candidatus Micrarchaeota archaeon]
MRTILFVLLLGGLLLFAGCTSQSGATQYVCPDGTVVSSPADCPAGGTSPETAPTTPTTPTTPPAQQTAPPGEEQLPTIPEGELGPAGCNYLTDNDCSTYSLGQKAITEDGMEVTISGPEQTEHCYTDLVAEGMDVWDFGYYYVLSVDIKNSGQEKQYVSYANFILVDSLGARYGADSYVNGENCEYAREFEGGDIHPGSVDGGELWFERGDQRTLPDGEKKAIFDPNGVIDGDELIFLVP